MIQRSVILVLVALLAGTSDASVWDRALTSPEDEAARDLYDAKMLEGDTATLTATIQSTSIASNLDSIRRAELAYRTAAARPSRTSGLAICFIRCITIAIPGSTSSRSAIRTTWRTPSA